MLFSLSAIQAPQDEYYLMDLILGLGDLQLIQAVDNTKDVNRVNANQGEL